MSTTALAAVLAKFAGLNVAAKAAVGIAVAAGAVGAAAGVPAVVAEINGPSSEQVAVADDPTEAPTAEPTDDPTTDPTADPTSEPTEDPTAEPTDEPSGWQDFATFGQWVRTQAREGGVDGQAVAAAAHERNQVRAENRVQDGTCDATTTDCTGDQDQEQARDQDRDQDGTCDATSTDCTGDQDQDQVKDQTKDQTGTGSPGRSGDAPGRGH